MPPLRWTGAFDAVKWQDAAAVFLLGLNVALGAIAILVIAFLLVL